jgi:alternate signal-mediated exported protein
VISLKTYTLVATALASLILLSSSGVFALDSNDSDSKKSVTNYFEPAEISIGVIEKSTTPVTEMSYTLTSNTKGTLSVDKPVEILNVDASNTNSADAFIRATIVPMWVTTDSATTQNFVVGAMNDIIDSNKNGKVLQSEVAVVTQKAEDDEDKTVTATSLTSVGYVSDNNNEYLDIAPFEDLTGITIDANNTFTLGDVTFKLVNTWKDYWIFNSKDGYFYYKYVVGVGKKTTQLLESVSINDSKLYRHDGKAITLRVDVLADSVQALGGAFDDVWDDVGLVKGSETTVNAGDTTHKYGYVIETTTTATPAAN